jgi:hypothetical protein
LLRGPRFPATSSRSSAQAWVVTPKLMAHILGTYPSDLQELCRSGICRGVRARERTRPGGNASLAVQALTVRHLHPFGFRATLPLLCCKSGTRRIPPLCTSARYWICSIAVQKPLPRPIVRSPGPGSASTARNRFSPKSGPGTAVPRRSPPVDPGSCRPRFQSRKATPGLVEHPV